MIPALRHIVATHAFLARRHDWRSTLDHILVQGCLKEARLLAMDEGDEPAALFFAFCKVWVRLGDACAVLPDLLARNHARAVKLDLLVLPEELRGLRLRIAAGKVGFPEVRDWFHDHLKPIPRAP